MGRHSVIEYSCDWCHDRAPATYPNGYTRDEDHPPEGWEEIEYALLCLTCQAARKEAVSYAQHRRLNKWPLVMDETRPAQHKSALPKE
jgi:predicted metalloenzyme YecM